MDAMFEYNNYQSNSISTSLHDILEEVLHFFMAKKRLNVHNNVKFG